MTLKIASNSYGLDLRVAYRCCGFQNSRGYGYELMGNCATILAIDLNVPRIDGPISITCN